MGNVRPALDVCETERVMRERKERMEEGRRCYVLLYVPLHPEMAAEGRELLPPATSWEPWKPLQGGGGSAFSWDSHLLQRVAHFNPLPLHCGLARSPRHVRLLQLVQLIGAGGI